MRVLEPLWAFTVTLPSWPFSRSPLTISIFAAPILALTLFLKVRTAKEPAPVNLAFGPLLTEPEIAST